MSLADPLPANFEVCECGHLKEWHHEGTFYLIAIDIDIECECKEHRPRMTLLGPKYFEKKGAADGLRQATQP